MIFAHNLPSLKLFEQFSFQRWGYLPQVADLDGTKRDVVIVGLHLEERKNNQKEEVLSSSHSRGQFVESQA